MNSFNETILKAAERVSSSGLLSGLLDRVVSRIAPSQVATGACAGRVCKSRCYGLCGDPQRRPMKQYYIDPQGMGCGYWNNYWCNTGACCY